MEHVVSIILTSYNKPKTISKAIESVLQQTYTNWELFIMDDNSDQEIVNIINRFLSDPRIHYINSNIQNHDRYKTTRYATLINQAIPLTTGKYLTYLTDDNLYLPARLLIMVKTIEENPHIDIVYSQQMVRSYNDNSNLEKEIIRKTYGIMYNPAGLVDHCSVMHTREIANQIYNKYGNYWDDGPASWFNGDAAFWNRLVKFKPFHPISEILDIAIKEPNSFQRLYQYLPHTIPDGILIQSPSSDIYLLDGQKRRKITTDVFEKLRYNLKSVVKIPDPFLYKYEEGNIIDNRVLSNPKLFPTQRIIKSPRALEMYYIQKGKKHRISIRAFKDYYFNKNEIVVIEEEFINQFSNGLSILEITSAKSILPNGILFKAGIHYFLSLNFCLHPIDKKVAIKLGFSLEKSVKVSRRFISMFQKGELLTWEADKL